MGSTPPRRKTDRALVPTVYCPRCDKPFNSGISRVENMKLVRAHARKAHKDDEESIAQLFD